MNAITVFVLVAAAMAAMTLFSGVAAMAHGGDVDRARANGLMFRRVVWQGLAVVLILLALLTTTE